PAAVVVSPAIVPTSPTVVVAGVPALGGPPRLIVAERAQDGGDAVNAAATTGQSVRPELLPPPAESGTAPAHPDTAPAPPRRPPPTRPRPPTARRRLIRRLRSIRPGCVTPTSWTCAGSRPRPWRAPGHRPAPPMTTEPALGRRAR